MSLNSQTSLVNEVVLYSAANFPPKEPLVYNAKNKKKSQIPRFFGFLFLLISLTGLTLNFGPLFAREVQFRIDETKKEVQRVVNQEPPKEPTIKFADLLGQSKFEPVQAPVNPNFSIVIPKINVNEEVVANVDPEKYVEFMAALKKGVAHAAGSAYPGQGGTVYIFAHSAYYQWDITRFNAVFYQLKDLEIGDEVNVFYNNRRYFYKVFETKIVKPSEVAFLYENQGERLILQTCWPLGTTKERLLVVAKPISLASSYPQVNSY